MGISMGKTVNEIRKEFQEARTGISNEYIEYMKNNVTHMAQALGVTENEIVEAFKSQGNLDEKTKRLRKILETANLKAAHFRDKLLERLAEWDRENPDEPLQIKFNIYVTLEPKNHS